MEDNTVLIPKEYTVVLNGKEYRVYPMKLKDYHRSDKLFSKINDEYLFLNLPTPVTDSLGNVVKDEKGNVKLDYTAFNAMCDIFEMALRIPRKEVVDVIDLENGVQVLDMFRGISGLKKKIMDNLNQIPIPKLG